MTEQGPVWLTTPEKVGGAYQFSCWKSKRKVFSYEEIHGGSPWGSGTYAGPVGSRQPTSMELSIAENHGRHFAKLTAKISA